MKFKTLILGAALSLTLASCGNDAIPVQSVALDKESAVLVVGDTLQLHAAVEPENATNQNVTWSSNHEEYATVSEEGLVTAVAPGEAVITVTTVDGEHTASCAVTVKRLVSGVSLDKESAVMYVGDELTLQATVAPADASNKAVTWSITGEGATVDANGKVTATGVGNSTVTVTTADGNFIATDNPLLWNR